MCWFMQNKVDLNGFICISEVRHVHYICNILSSFVNSFKKVIKKMLEKIGLWSIGIVSGTGPCLNDCLHEKEL